MLTINLVSLGEVVYGPSVTLIGHLGPSGGLAPAGQPTELVVPWQDLHPDPSVLALLSWRTRVSEFAGRDTELSALEAWAAGAPAVSVKFVTGDGGVGKSRLAAEFATNLKQLGWAAGFVDLRRPCSFLGKGPGTLLVIDYPEENRAAAGDLLRDLSWLGLAVRFRVLFLTRQGLDDWIELIHDCRAEALVDMAPIEIGGLDDHASWVLFCSAQERVGESLNTLPRPVSEEAFSAWLRQEPEHERSLFIVAAAVYSALQPDDEVVRYRGRAIIEALAQREVTRLRMAATNQGVSDAYALARLVAMAAIADTLPAARVRSLARERHRELGLPEGLDLVPLLHAAGLLSDRTIRAPKPDIIAAALAVTVLCQEPESASELVWAALADDIPGGLSRLARLSHDAEVVLGLIQYRLSQWLAEAVSGRPDRCAVLEPLVVGPQIPLGWVPTAAVVCQTLLELARGDEDRARLLNNLGTMLSELGQREEALRRRRRRWRSTGSWRRRGRRRFCPISQRR